MSTAGPVYWTIMRLHPFVLKQRGDDGSSTPTRKSFLCTSVWPCCSNPYGSCTKDHSRFIECATFNLTFTSGGTESNNMVLAGFQTVLASSVEHEAVLAACPEAHLINVDENGVVSLRHLEPSVSFVRSR